MTNTLSNPTLRGHSFLQEMFDDDYFPNVLVEKVKTVLVELCQAIESQRPDTEAALFALTHAATEKINDLQEDFEDQDSEIETGAREAIAADFETIVQAYGFPDVDIEEVIAPRDW